ncbi:MAG: helix-turn-helix domain-containing protein [Azoarcus sp.]|jgi:putative transcriptional regulator|nr:helix-turn-helix domain-containing protein [Azoarcus sp.]
MDDATFADLMQSVRDAGRYLRGEKVPGAKVTEAQDVRALRESARVSQAEFARLLGVSKRTLENWEQHRTVPSGPARALLKIVASNPQAAVEALHS